MENTSSRIDASIIIPTYNRGEILVKAVNLIERQKNNYRLELMIIDDGSNAINLRLINKLSKRFDNIVLKIQQHAGPARARNWAIRKAGGQILIFLNDDSFVDNGFIKRHLDFHGRHPKINESLSGKTMNHPETINSMPMRWLVGQSGMHFNYHFKNKGIAPIPWYYLWTCNFSIKKEFVETNALQFCEEFPTAAWEDIEFAYRSKNCGLKVFFDSKAVVFHFHELNFEDIKNRFISHGRGLFYLKNKLPENFLPFLIKSSLGRLILGVFKNNLWGKILTMGEKRMLHKDRYPNWLMQLLVIKWKADGYKIEESKM